MYLNDATAGGTLDWLDTHSGAVAALATVATAVIAILALWGTWRDSAARSRPYISAELIPEWESITPAVSLAITNTGPTVARDLTVTFDPPIPRQLPKAAVLAPYIRDRYSATIPALGAGQSLRNIWWMDNPAPPGTDATNELGLSGQFTVKVSYRGRSRRQYRDEFPLSIKLTLAETRITSSTRSVQGQLGKIADALRRMAPPLGTRINHPRSFPPGGDTPTSATSDAPPEPTT